MGCSFNNTSDNFDDKQYIENYFSNQIEGDYKTSLEQIIKKVITWSAWKLKNCFFISEEEKRNISFFLAIQYIRIKHIRELLFDTENCLKQALMGIGASSEIIEKYCVGKSQLSNIHREMILDQSEIKHLTNIFSDYAWILRVNKTNKMFFTSDNPIGTIPHTHDSYISTSGLQSKGVEVCFPISPQIMLTMYEKSYHNQIIKYDRRIVEMDIVEDVEYYNRVCALHSTRCIFSCQDDFLLIEKMLKENPDILNTPQTVLHWGGKTFIPER